MYKISMLIVILMIVSCKAMENKSPQKIDAKQTASLVEPHITDCLDNANLESNDTLKSFRVESILVYTDLTLGPQMIFTAFNQGADFGGLTIQCRINFNKNEIESIVQEGPGRSKKKILAENIPLTRKIDSILIKHLNQSEYYTQSIILKEFSSVFKEKFGSK